MRSARIRLPGHPDRVCDLVAEAIVDEYLRRDVASQLALHVSGGRGALFVSGDIKSQADFDVSSLVRRTLGSLSVLAETEPFIALEAVSPEQADTFGRGIDSPVTVHGYATQETAKQLPTSLVLAQEIARGLFEKRQTDERWFWLGPDADVCTLATSHEPSEVYVRIEHGSKTLLDARGEITAFVQSLAPQLRVKVNELGPQENRGLGYRMGASGGDGAVYGSVLPATTQGIGLDPGRAEKAGSWLARAAARKLVERGARAALVQVVYIPGEQLPAFFVARDEQGKNITSGLTREELSLQRVMREWWRPGLNSEAARWGFVGEVSLPWET